MGAAEQFLRKGIVVKSFKSVCIIVFKSVSHFLYYNGKQCIIVCNSVSHYIIVLSLLICSTVFYSVSHYIIVLSLSTLYNSVS